MTRTNIEQYDFLKKVTLTISHKCISIKKTFVDLENLSKRTNKAHDIFQLVKQGLRKNDYYFPNQLHGEFSNIANYLSYKLITNISLNKANQLESNFVEIINSKKQCYFQLTS